MAEPSGTGLVNRIMRVQSPSLAPFYQVPREVTAACSALNGVVLVRVQPGQPVSARDGNQAYLAVSETADCRCNSDRADQFASVVKTQSCESSKLVFLVGVQADAPISKRHRRSGLARTAEGTGREPVSLGSASLPCGTNEPVGSARTAQPTGLNPVPLRVQLSPGSPIFTRRVAHREQHSGSAQTR